MEFNEDTKIKLELNYIEASIVMDLINKGLDESMTQMSMKSIVEYTMLKGIGQRMIDQIIPKEEQEKIKQQNRQQKEEKMAKYWEKEFGL